MKRSATGIFSMLCVRRGFSCPNGHLLPNTQQTTITPKVEAYTEPVAVLYTGGSSACDPIKNTRSRTLVGVANR